MVAAAIASQCRRITPGEPITHRTLRIVPLVGESGSEPTFQILSDRTLEKIRLTEIDESGSVPAIRIRNDLGDRLLLIDGQELVGCKQNRILNTDVLIAAGADLELPVSCVEAGRWSPRSRQFWSGRSADSGTRSSKLADVHQSLRASKGFSSDQGRVWEGVRHLMAACRASSDSGALHDIYVQRASELEEIRSKLSMPENAIGYAVYDGPRLLGMDLFDRVSTMTGSWAAMIDGYLITWLSRARGAEAGIEPDEPAEPEMPIETVLERLPDEAWERRDSPGDGDDMRFESDRLMGSALVVDDAVLHLQVFPKGNG